MKRNLIYIFCIGLFLSLSLNVPAEKKTEETKTEKIKTNDKTITMSLRGLSLLEVLNYVTEISNLKYRIDKNVIVITDQNAVSDKIITKIYPVQPSAMQKLNIRKTRRFKNPDLEDFFK